MRKHSYAYRESDEPAAQIIIGIASVLEKECLFQKKKEEIKKSLLVSDFVKSKHFAEIAEGED